MSPAAARASSAVPKTKKQQAQKGKPPSPKKRLFNSHQSSVSNISDLRLHKRGRINKDTKDEDCIIVDSDSDTEDPHLLMNAGEQKKKTASQTLVTPSPHPSRRQAQQKQQKQQQPNATPLYNSSRSLPQQGKGGASGRTTSPHFATNPSGKNRVVRNQSSSWFQQKKQQKTSQSSAFNSPKENPFSSYSFDPNSIEKSLDSQAVRSKEQSIFPPSVAASNFTATKPCNSRTFRTPAIRRKNASSSSRISSHDLLQRKANELNQHRHEMMASRDYDNHDEAFQDSVSGPFHQQTWTAGNGFTQAYDLGNYEPNHFSQPHQPFHQQQQQQQYVQPQLNSFRSTFHEDSFDQRRGPFGHQYEFSQQMSRPGTSTGSVMTSNRFMNMPYRQQFVQPQHSTFHPSYHYHDEESFPQQMHYRPGTAMGSGASVMTSNRYMSMPPSQHFFTQPSQFRSEHVTQNYVEHGTQNYHRAAEGSMSSHHGYMRSAPVQNYMNGRPHAAGSVVNPYRQQNQDANSGPPLEVVVQNRDGADESASQFEDAFF